MTLASMVSDMSAINKIQSALIKISLWRHFVTCKWNIPTFVTSRRQWFNVCTQTRLLIRSFTSFLPDFVRIYMHVAPSYCPRYDLSLKLTYFGLYGKKNHHSYLWTMLIKCKSTYFWNECLAHPVHTLNIQVKRKVPVFFLGVQDCSMEHKSRGKQHILTRVKVNGRIKPVSLSLKYV